MFARNIKQIQGEFKYHWKKNGFLEFSPASVVSPPATSNSLFISYGFMNHLKRIEAEGTLECSFVGSQPCIECESRNLPPPKAKIENGCFNFFRQLNCVAVNGFSLDWFTVQIWIYLTHMSRLDPARICLGINPAGPEITKHWNELGAFSDNIFLLKNSANKLSVPALNLEGYYHSLVYDRGRDHHLACDGEGCGIYCDCGRFLELGNIGVIRLGEKYILDHNINLERLASVRFGLDSVADISEILGLADFAASRFFVSREKSLILSDYFRSVLVLVGSGLTSFDQWHGFRFSNVLHQIFKIIPNERFNDHSLRLVLEEAAKSVGETYFSIIDDALELIFSEYLNYLEKDKKSQKTINLEAEEVLN